MLQASGIRVAFGTTVALDGISLQVGDGEVVAVLGPSGSGKTTLLRVVAGLQAPDAGTVSWDGADVTGVAPHRRGFGMVFQDFALFPHLDVAANVAFGLRMQGLERRERAERVAEALAGVDLSGFERRAVSTLSGGQAQRVALARALAPRPRMLLFDEPLGSLDRVLRDRLVDDLRRLLAGPGITSLYVTHDQSEAFAVADRVAVIVDGRLRQVATPEEVWCAPADTTVAEFLGFRTVLEAVVTGGWADTAIGRIPAPPGTGDGPASIVVRPDALRIDPGGPLRAVVTAARFRGTDSLVEADAGGIALRVAARHAPRPGTEIRLAIDPAGLAVLEEPGSRGDPPAR